VINEFTGYVLSHQGKATDPENIYDPANGADTFTNPNAYEKVVQYTEAVRKRHGEAYDPATDPLNTDVLMRTGGGEAAWAVLSCPQRNRPGHRSHPS